MGDGIRIERIGSATDEKTGAVAHDHDVYDGEQKVGSFKVSHSPDAKMPQFKMGGGLKTRHAGHVLKYISENYMKKSIVGTSMAPTTGAKAEPPTEPGALDHDRRRIKRAAMALLGSKDTPTKPDGKINKAMTEDDREWLAKSVAVQAEIDSLRPKLHQMGQDLSNRPSFNPHHDYSAWMMTHAHHQLQMADKHLNRPKASLLDRVRGTLRLEPAYSKHLNAAKTYMKAAESFMHHGDRHQNKLDSKFPAPKGQSPAITHAEYKLVHGATKGRESVIRGQADRLKNAFYDAGTSTKTPPAPRGKPVKPSKP